MSARSLPVFLVAVLLSVVAAAGTAILVGSARAPESRAAGSSEDVAALAKSLGDLARRQEELGRAIEDLRAASHVSAEPARLAVGELDAAVARYMEEQGRSGGGSDEPEAALAQAKAEPAQSDIDAALAKLLDPSLDDVDRQKLWREFSARGLTDALIAEYEARAEREPNNPDRKVELGEAYLQKIFEVGNSPLAGVWATKADGAFDAALALDENHWSARFNKAVSLSFWPPVFGKQNEAISHFETLVAQQAKSPKKAEFASTHLLLGNMYQQMGETEKALAAWERGLEQFPGNADLAKQIALAKGN